MTRLLFLGNSHTARHDVPGTVERLLRGLEPGAEIVAVLGPGSMHLDERGEDAETLESVAAQSWDFVVLQAQNYSLSGCCDYPTTGAESLVRLVGEQGAVPVLYAEWARRGIDETDLIIETYQRIAERQPACLPPVPEAFDIALGVSPAWSSTPRTATTRPQRAPTSPRPSWRRRSPADRRATCRSSSRWASRPTYRRSCGRSPTTRWRDAARGADLLSRRRAALAPHGAAQRLGQAAVLLAVQASLASGAGRLGGTARRRRGSERLPDQVGESLAGGDAVAVLGAVLRGDDDDATVDEPAVEVARGRAAAACR